MPLSPPTEDLDDHLTDMGRALAKSLLGDEPTRRPRRGTPDSATRPAPRSTARPAPRPAIRHVNGPATVRNPADFDHLPWPPDDEITPDESATPDGSGFGQSITELPLHEPPTSRKPSKQSTKPSKLSRKRSTESPEPDPENDAAPERVRTPSRLNRFVNSLVEWGMVVGAALIVALLLQHFVFQIYSIPSESMFPTLKIGDRVAVNRLSYVFGGGVERGDVIVFKRPASEDDGTPDQPDQFIKRVIGLPGEVVEAREGVVYVDGTALAETGSKGYLATDVVTNNLSQPVTVPADSVFVMGDNRERSRDSRFFGAVPQSDIIGRALVIAWPSDRWSSL